MPVPAAPPFDPVAFLVEFCSIPTAPFREHLVMHAVDAFARARRGIRATGDALGNTLLVRPGRRGGTLPRLIFVAHLDHPGFVARQMTEARTLRADFRGGVLASLVRGSRVLFFDAAGEVRARVTDVVANADGRCIEATLRVARAVEPLTIGMFDVGVGRVRGNRFHCRCCDDLAGAAAALAMLAELGPNVARCDVGVLLTRGEEHGFVGAIGAAIDGVAGAKGGGAAGPALLRRDDRILSIECSAEQPVARQGEGVVLRIGDKTSVFHSAFARFMFDAATALAAEDDTFRFQRALMPGGTCEATVFDAWGYVAGAACVPLGNYHNMDKARERIAAEHVHLDDWRNMVKLFVRLARTAHAFDGSHGALRQRLTDRFEANRQYLRMDGTLESGA